VAVLDEELVYIGAFILRYFAPRAAYYVYVQLLLDLEMKKTEEQ
jgi:hypothetical protein